MKGKLVFIFYYQNYIVKWPTDNRHTPDPTILTTPFENKLTETLKESYKIEIASMFIAPPTPMSQPIEISKIHRPSGSLISHKKEVAIKSKFQKRMKLKTG